MTAPLASWWEALGDAFWLRPAIVVLAGLALGLAAVAAERAGFTGDGLPDALAFGGGEGGARAVLGAVAASSIGVAGTIFSITVAALSLASGQMGPGLLRNFVRDRGNQYALGIFLGTFSYALVVLRTVRSVEEGGFVPHLGVTAGLVLALLCVGTLVWFVHHIATGINVETVINVVQGELLAAIERLTRPADGQPGGEAPVPPRGAQVRLDGAGYLRSLDTGALADWAAERGCVLVLRHGPGDHVLAGAVIAEVSPAGEAAAAAAAVGAATAFGDRRAIGQDLEFPVRQLVEIAVRALSPGINDPFTAMLVLERLGAALAALRSREMPPASVERDGRTVLHLPATGYAGLCDAMFHMIRQYGEGSAAVLIRLVDTLAAVAAVEPRPDRRAALRRHADMALAAGRGGALDASALAVLEARWRTFVGVVEAASRP